MSHFSVAVFCEMLACLFVLFAKMLHFLRVLPDLSVVWFSILWLCFQFIECFLFFFLSFLDVFCEMLFCFLTSFSFVVFSFFYFKLLLLSDTVLGLCFYCSVL